MPELIRPYLFLFFKNEYFSSLHQTDSILNISSFIHPNNMFYMVGVKGKMVGGGGAGSAQDMGRM